MKQAIETGRQAIETKYLGPTNYRGSRVKATAQAGSVTVPWDCAADADTNHRIAALALASKYGWLANESGRRSVLIGGARADGRGNVYVVVPESVVRDVP